MESRSAVLEKSGGVGVITLNRPAKLNAISFEMLDVLFELLQDVAADDAVRVVLVTGEGRYFSAGADLEIVATLTPATFRTRQREYWNRVFGELADIAKPTIAALNGPALGGGLELALCCDLRYAVDDATFALPEINFGILPDSGGTVRLPLLIGPARAKELILSGDSITARRAEEVGLVNGVFTRDTFDVEVREIAGKMARKAPLALGLGKQLIDRSIQHRDVMTGLEDVMEAQSTLIESEDYQEALRAFREKRPPEFHGR
jgi:enoyl-CoA hydratase